MCSPASFLDAVSPTRDRPEKFALVAWVTKVPFSPHCKFPSHLPVAIKSSSIFQHFAPNLFVSVPSSLAKNTVPMAQPDHVCSPIPSATLLHLANVFWAASAIGGYTSHCLQPYSEYYAEQCKTFYHTLGANLPFSKHGDIIQLGQEIHQGLTQEQVVQSLQNRYPATASNAQLDNVEITNGVVDLAARLLLMVNRG